MVKRKKHGTFAHQRATTLDDEFCGCGTTRDVILEAASLVEAMMSQKCIVHNIAVVEVTMHMFANVLSRRVQIISAENNIPRTTKESFESAQKLCDSISKTVHGMIAGVGNQFTTEVVATLHAQMESQYETSPDGIYH